MKKIFLIILLISSISAFSQSYRMRSQGSIEQPELENISGNNIDLSDFSNPSTNAEVPAMNVSEGSEDQQSSDDVASGDAKQFDVKETKTIQDIVLSVYPNPASNFIVVKLNENALTTITIMNLVGQVVQTENVEALENYINIEPLLQGVYFVSIEYNGQKIVKKLKVLD